MRGLPANQGATVGQARPEGDEQGKIAGFDPTGASSLVNREGNGGGRGVTVAFEIDEKAVHREFEKLGDGVDDPEFGLTRHHAIHFVRVYAMLFQDVSGGVFHLAHGEFKYFAAFHLDET